MHVCLLLFFSVSLVGDKKKNCDQLEISLATDTVELKAVRKKEQVKITDNF